MKSAYRNLMDFVARLEQAGELLRVRAPVSPRLEITHITDLASKSPGGGKALLFERVEGSAFPVLTNAFGSERRICMALGTPRLDDLAARVSRFVEMEPPRSLRDAVRMAPMALDLFRFLPRRWKRGTPPCQEVKWLGGSVDLGRLPVLTCWPGDGGPFVTLPIVITRSLRTGRRNAGMYRLQIYDAKTTGMHWHIHKDGSNYFGEYRRSGKRMPVAVAIGSDPATTYAATAPLPRGVDEMILSGFIRKKPVPMARCVTVDLEVPAEAEIVLEGYVDPEERRMEGPFGDHTGYYSLADEYPVFHLTALTHRRNAIYPATVVGRPPMEDCYLAQATERIFLPLLKTVLPEIHDYWLPWEGVFHNVAVVAIRKEYPGHARKVMSALWGQGQMSFCKMLVLVDDSVDLKNPARFLETLLDRVDLSTDLYVTEGVLDVLDHSAPDPLFGGKLGVDATSRLPGERPRHSFPSAGDFPAGPEIREALVQVSPHFSGYRVPPMKARHIPLLLNLIKDGSVSGRRLAEPLLDHPALKGFSLFVLCDEGVDLGDGSRVLWKGFNNVDPERDLVRRNGRVVVDATKKGPEDGHFRLWPDDIVMDPVVVESVRERARELNIEELLAGALEGA